MFAAWAVFSGQVMLFSILGFPGSSKWMPDDAAAPCLFALLNAFRQTTGAGCCCECLTQASILRDQHWFD